MIGFIGVCFVGVEYVEADLAVKVK